MSYKRKELKKKGHPKSKDAMRRVSKVGVNRKATKKTGNSSAGKKNDNWA